MLSKMKDFTRRGFLKAMAAVGATTIYGCSKNDDSTEYVIGGSGGGGDTGDPNFTVSPVMRWGTSTHNCTGARCVIRAQVSPEGRIVRFLTDETQYAANGDFLDPENRNVTQSRACARCRSYRGRLYHPGRLRHPLKQTKERGDGTGFVRISWATALSEIAARMKAVQGKYGATALHAIYACGSIASAYQGASYTGVYSSVGGISSTLRLLGGASAYTSDYSFHQGSYLGNGSESYTGVINGGTGTTIQPLVQMTLPEWVNISSFGGPIFPPHKTPERGRGQKA